MEGKGPILKQERFRLDGRKNSFSMRTVRQWNIPPREVMQSLSSEIAKDQKNL